MELKRIFYGRIPSTGECVEILDHREVIDITTQHNVYSRSIALGAIPHCCTRDGREVRVKDGLFKYVDYENLRGEWEICADNGDWIPLAVSSVPMP